MKKLTIGQVVDLQFGLRQLNDLSNDKNAKMSPALRYKTFILIDKSKEPILAYEKALSGSLKGRAVEVPSMPGQVDGTKWRFHSLDDREAHEEELDKLRGTDSSMNVSISLSLTELIALKMGADALVSLKSLLEDDVEKNSREKEAKKDALKSTTEEQKN